MNTDASPEISAAAYQSAAIACAHCEAAGGISIRLGANASKGRDANKNRLLAQRATVRYCPCCVVETLVCAPVNYAWGGRDMLKEQAAAL